MPDATLRVSIATDKGVAGRRAQAIDLAWKLLLVGFICAVSTEVGFAHKFPPHNISPLWPTGAILFGILVVAPVRHWWAYAFAAYFYSAIKAGVNAPAFLFLAAALIEQFIAAAAVRRFAGGLRAFDTLRNLIVYLLGAVVLAPFTSAFVGAFAGGEESYWFYWRVWLLSEALALLTLAPAILTLIANVQSVDHAAIPRGIEPWLIGVGLLVVTFRVFHWPTAGHGAIAALVYLPLPLLLWAAMRFGPVGANTGLLILAAVSISGAVRGLGPFAVGAAPASVLSLQLFLVAVSVPVMFLATAIEERRAAEHAMQRHRAELAHVTRLSTMGELATSLAHELNQPLTAILSNAQAAQRFLGASPPNLTELGEILKDVVQDNKRASEVIQRLRALVRKDDIAFVALDIGDLLRDVVSIVHNDAILRHSRVLLDVGTGLPPVRGDRIQLQQVALNLLLNALEAMKDFPTARRQVVVRVDRDDAGMVRVAVRDWGVGVGGDAVDIFQPFYTTKPTGLGMGLSISRSIIEGHGGQLRAQNNPDQGATFWFTLPSVKT
jgi:signal transduction histidine kinase